MARERPDQTSLAEVEKITHWQTLEELRQTSVCVIDDYFLANQLLKFGNVKITGINKPKDNTGFFRDLEKLDNATEFLNSIGTEFYFAKTDENLYIKMEIAGERSLFFKTPGIYEKGGIMLLPQGQPFPKESYLRAIKIGKNGEDFTLVFGGNPTEVGRDRFKIVYKRKFERSLSFIS